MRISGIYIAEELGVDMFYNHALAKIVYSKQ